MPPQAARHATSSGRKRNRMADQSTSGPVPTGPPSPLSAILRVPRGMCVLQEAGLDAAPGEKEIQFCGGAARTVFIWRKAERVNRHTDRQAAAQNLEMLARVGRHSPALHTSGEGCRGPGSGG